MTQVQTANSNSQLSPADFRARLGDSLRNARLKAGVTVEAVAHETKISKQFIVSLEAGVFDNLPGQVFGRGFVKNIARFLRSDAGELLRLYDACWGDAKSAPPQVQETRPPETLSPGKETRLGVEDDPVSDNQATVLRAKARGIPDIKHLPSVEPKKTGVRLPGWLVRGALSQNTWLTILGSIAAVMVVGVLGRWIVAQINKPVHVTASPVAVVGSGESREISTEEAVKTDVVESSEAAALPSNIVEKVIDPNATKLDTTPPAASVALPSESLTKPQTSGAAVEASKSNAVAEDSPLKVVGSPVAFEQVLTLNVTSPVDIRVTVDGKKTERTTYAVGSTQLTFSDRAELFIQDASAVELSFNGKSLGSLGNKGRKRRLVFQAKPTESDFPN